MSINLIFKILSFFLSYLHLLLHIQTTLLCIIYPHFLILSWNNLYRIWKESVYKELADTLLRKQDVEALAEVGRSIDALDCSYNSNKARTVSNNS